MYIVSKKIFKSLLLSIFLASLALDATITKKLLYTTLNITDWRILGIVNSRAFRRLNNIQQYGIDSRVLPKRKHSEIYNRAIHSLGVYYLLQRFGASFEEQVTGLLHDASHTAFSHVGDKIFKHKDGKDSYQDLHHLDFLSKTDIPRALQTYCGLTLADIDHKNPMFTCLEQSIPNICADRLEYNLAGGILENLITRQEAREILDHLKFENNTWFFTDAYHAQKFARISLWHTEHVWGSQMSNYVSNQLAQAIQKAFKLDILAREEVIYGTDDAVWQKLCLCNSAEINTHIQNLTHAHEHEEEINKQPRNNKFRGINPWVLVGDEFIRLTELDAEFAQEYDRVKAESY